jgi:hypothetical protein
LRLDNVDQLLQGGAIHDPFVRGKRLTPEQLAVVLANMYRGDPRCVAYVHGGAWEHAAPLADTLLSERTERQRALEVAMTDRGVPAVEPTYQSVVDAFVDLGVGSADSVALDMAGFRHRRAALDAELRRLHLSIATDNRTDLLGLGLGLGRGWWGQDHEFVVSGVGTLTDAVAHYQALASERERERALNRSLRAHGFMLHFSGEVALRDERCKAFIAGTTPDTTAEELAGKLEEERQARLDALHAALAARGCPDVGADSDFYSEGIEDEYFRGYGGYGGFEDEFYPPWGSEECSATERFRFVEAGEGTADRVAGAMGEYHRGTLLLDRLKERGCPGWVAKEPFPDALLLWAATNEACEGYVTGRTGGSVESVVDGLVAGEQSDPLSEVWGAPDRPDYGDEEDGGDWKYHLSGGTYGDDPDQDAMWDAYWDV